MSLVTIGGLRVVRGTINMPRVGVWWGDFVLDSSNALSGAQTLTTDDGSFTLQGTVHLTGVYTNTLSLRMYGGGGGYSTALPPKSYFNVTVKTVLTDIVTACGEKLSSTSDNGILGTTLPFWNRNQTIGGRALRRVIETQPCIYRVLPDGSTFIGADTYPAAPTVKYDLLHRYTSEGRIVLGSERPWLLPGTTLKNDKISYLMHEIEPSTFRTTAWIE